MFSGRVGETGQQLRGAPSSSPRVLVRPDLNSVGCSHQYAHFKSHYKLHPASIPDQSRAGEPSISNKQKPYRINSQRLTDLKTLDSSRLKSPQTALAAAQVIPYHNRNSNIEEVVQSPKNLPVTKAGLQAMYQCISQELELQHVLPELQEHDVCR